MEVLTDTFTAKVAGAALILLLAWRTWRFTIRPVLYPREPKELPYWIPFLGHTFGFFKDFNGTIEKGRKHFHPSREPFAVTVAGETMYVATSPEDINAVWRNTRTISRDPIIMDMYTIGGLSEKTRNSISNPAQYSTYGETPVSLAEAVIKLHQQQLSKGPRLDALMKDRILPGLLKQLDFSDMNHPAVLSRSEKSTVVSLYQLCVHTFITGGTDAYWDPVLRQIAPDLVSAFADWDYVNWKMLFKVPDFLAGDMQKVKATIVNGFTEYYRLPRSERPGAIWWVEEFETVMQEAGLTYEEMGILALMHYWAIVGNTYKLCFWTLSHMLHDATLLEEIRHEVTPAINGDEINETYLLEQCPKLNSLGAEVLRLSATSSFARVTTSPSVVGGKTLKAGRKIMVPVSQLHTHTTWGPDPSVLQPARFVDNTKLANSIAYRPWGGGHSLCPGRFFARRAVNAFVASLLVKYDIEIEGKRGVPDVDATRPSPGIVGMVQGQDLKVRCTAR